jgi:NitT/TauT family transport system ATP-binding protein
MQTRRQDEYTGGLAAKIKARGVNKVFRTRREEGPGYEEFVALKDIDIDVYPGEFLTIVGPSGCGKSTFLDLMAGLDHPTSGEITIDGRVIKDPAMDRGFVMQGYALFPWLTVKANVEFGLEIKKIPKNKRAEISGYYIDLVGLTDFANRYPHEISGGMKQRVAIARALAFDPEVLLMDEPFAALDAQTREIMQEELLRIWEETKKTIVFVTHGIDEAVFLADRIAVMDTNPGRIKATLNVELSRPRQGVRGSAEFGWIRHKVWELLQKGELEENKETGSEQDIAKVIDARAVL